MHCFVVTVFNFCKLKQNWTGTTLHKIPTPACHDQVPRVTDNPSAILNLILFLVRLNEPKSYNLEEQVRCGLFPVSKLYQERIVHVVKAINSKVRLQKNPQIMNKHGKALVRDIYIKRIKIFTCTFRSELFLT